MKTVVKIALGVVLGLTVLIVGCAALLGAGASSVQDDLDKAARDASRSTDGSAATPRKPRKARNFATGDAQGDFAIASAAGTVNDPGEIRVKVTSVPSAQQGKVSWTMSCTTGTGVGSKDGQFDTTTPIRRALPKPQASPDDCIVSANVQLDRGGKVKIALAG